MSHPTIPAVPAQIRGTIAPAARPFTLDDASRVWQVGTGRLEVFSVALDRDAELAHRRFLFSVNPGEVVFGASPLQDGPSPIRLLAVPVGGTMLISADLAALLAGDDAGQQGADFGALAAAAARVLAGAIAPPRSPRTDLTVEADARVVLKEGQRFTAARDLVWAEVLSGTAHVADGDQPPLTSADPPFPLTGEWWLTAATELEVQLHGADALPRLQSPAAALARMVRRFMLSASLAARQEEESELTRFEARSEEEYRSRVRGLRELAEVLGEVRSDELDVPPAHGDELLAAMQLVGTQSGIVFRQAPEWERAARRNDPLQAICRASRIRCRQIGLRGDWWTPTVDVGHFLAFLKQEDERRPVAVLRDGRRGYVIADPVTGRRTAVDAAAAAQLEPMGFSFYKPFPDRALDRWDLGTLALDAVRGDVRQLLGIALAGALIGLILPWATNRMLSDVVPMGSRNEAVLLLLALVGVQLGSAFFDAAKAFILVRIEGRTSTVLQAGVVDRMLALPARFFRQFTVGDLASRASGINVVRDMFTGAAATSLLSGIFALVFLLQLWWFSARLAVVAVGVMVVAVGATAFLVARSVAGQREQQEIAGKLSGFTVQLMGAIPKVRVAGAEDRAFAQWSQRMRRQKEISWASSHNDIAIQVFNTILPLLASMALFASAGWMTLEGKEYALDPGTFVAFNVAFGTFFGSVVSFSNTMVTVLAALPMLERAEPILSALPELSGDRSDPGALSGRIDVSHVTFRYRADGPVILDDVSFSVTPGEFIAFVGPSGSGKSTCLRLLLGFEEPEAGAIYFDGQDIDSLDLTAVRSQMGVVLQTSKLSQGDIYQNIVGSSPLSLDDAWEAAEAAGLDEDIAQMPMQMHTVVSEGGSTLSGGQRQRLLIARALVRKPSIILFDEATSALDNRTQELVSQSLEKTNATRIVIAHRLSTVRNADRIYVMDRGRIIQSGTFEELATQPGMFAQLVARQLV
jgi:NHLM bacteriocin system ABC transporter ATP-binding protein